MKRARRTATAAGAATAALTFGLAVGLHDRDALLLTIGLALAVIIAIRRPLLGGLGLAALLLDVAVWMGLAFVSHVQNDDPVVSLVLSGLLLTSSIVGLVALAVQSVNRERPGREPRKGRPFAAAGFGLVWGLAAAVVVAIAPSAVSIPAEKDGRLVVSIKNSRFSREELHASAGWTNIVVANPDLFWHTFTVPDLDIDITVPVGSVRSADAKLPPGKYQYLCRVPGHSKMLGVLVVA